MRTVLFILAVLAAAPAAAHVGPAVGPEGLWAEWRPEPTPIALLCLTLLVYGRGIARLWTRAGFGRGVTIAETAAFGAGLGSTALALLSPLETVASTLLTGHMVQHVLLITVAPPLLLLGRPEVAFAAALQSAARSRIARVVLTGWRRLAQPVPAALLHAAVIWVWHAPRPFQAALAHPLLHDLEHASFLVTALLFWQCVVTALRQPISAVTAILAALFTLIQSGFLGALITLAGRPLYPAYGDTALWGLTPLQDQQLGGLIMWVPAGAVYLIAGLALAARLIGSDSADDGGRLTRAAK